VSSKEALSASFPGMRADAPESVLISRLLKQAQFAFACRTEPSVVRRREINCLYSVVTRIEMQCDGVSRVVYLKRRKARRDIEVARERVMAEYNILSRLSEHFREHGTFGVARPIAVFPEELALATEEVRGTGLMGLIGRSAKRYTLGGRQDLLEQYCRLAGGWLQEFQSITPQGSGDFNIQGLMRYCDQRLAILIADGRSGIDGKFKARFAEYLNRQHSRLTGPTRIVGRHNDFSPHNIIVSGNCLSVLDFGFFDYDSYIYDLCSFWFKLEYMKSSPLFSPATIDRLQYSFFEGYGSSAGRDDPAFDLVALQFILTRMASLAGKGLRRGVRGWFDRRSYAWCLSWLTERCTAA
jgi:hypothetical protein